MVGSGYDITEKDGIRKLEIEGELEILVLLDRNDVSAATKLCILRRKRHPLAVHDARTILIMKFISIHKLKMIGRL